MPRYPDSLAGNVRSLQRQINRIATAPLGPVSIGPDDGHLRFYTPDGDTFVVAASGAQVKHRGALTGLTPHLEANTAKQEQQDTQLSDHGAALSQQGSQLTAVEGRLSSHDSTLASHGTRIGNAESKNASQDSVLGTMNTTQIEHASRLSGVEKKNTSQDTTIGALNEIQIAHDSRIKAAQARADAAYSLAGSALSDAATAKARADAAYSLAAGRASDGDVSAALATAKQYTDSRLNALVTALRNQGIAVVL